ncbi:cupin domain-containing protein [Micromonospora sp. SL1-18]|uniref:cupin domain-containing protein n=1 Tax=Micromonospora sp. SL1-18 TaxID=3399128 RepID=UPI003A4D62D9
MTDQRLTAWSIDRRLEGHPARTNINVAFVDGAYAMRVAQLRETFPPHRHDSDESWFVYQGRMRVDSEIGSVEVGAGEGVVIPAGVRHSPTCLEPGTIVLIVNRRGQRTLPDDHAEFVAAGATDIDDPA